MGETDDNNNGSSTDHVLSFTDLKFSVGNEQQACGVSFLTSAKNNKKNKKKLIIDSISGRVQCGQMVSVMGPSGAGKTTLLNVLSLRATYGDNFGKLLLDGAPLDSDIFKSKCFLVGQYDKNWPHLTVQETCTFAARLFGIVKKEIDITNIVHEVGLTDVLHSRNSSLSGGQQRRLSLAIALLKQPAVLFLDEVTSGLDSASADRVCKALRRIVDEKNIMVICTIHQPSTKIFLECFDQLILLSKGRVAYAGGTRRAEDYFSCLGYPVPAMTNPSEHYLELVNSDFGDVETVDKIIDAWEQETSDAGADIDVEHQSQSNTGTIFSPDLKLAKQSLFQETQIVLRRHFIMICRDPVLYLGRCITALVMNCIFACVYWSAREYTQDQLMAKGWLVVWFASVPVMMGAVAVYVLNDELLVIQSEQKNGMLRPASYIMAKVVLTLPFIFVFAIFALGIPGFAIQNYQTSSWIEVILLWSILAYLFESLAECLAIWVKNKVLGMLVYLTYWISSFLFSGLFLPLDDLIWPLKIFYYTTPFSYYIRSMYYLLFNDTTFESCDSELNPLEPICVKSGAGSEAIEGLHAILPLFENKDTLTTDISVLLIMIIFLKVIYIAGVVVRGREVSIPNPTNSTMTNEEAGIVTPNEKSTKKTFHCSGVEISVHGE